MTCIKYKKGKVNSKNKREKKKPSTHPILPGCWEVLNKELDLQQEKKKILIFLDILAATQLTCFSSTWQDTFPANCKYAYCWWAAGKSPTPLGNCHHWEISASSILPRELSEGQPVPTLLSLGDTAASLLRWVILQVWPHQQLSYCSSEDGQLQRGTQPCVPLGERL